MGARTTETNRQGRAGQTSGTNVHKANLGSQLSIFDTALARTTRLNEFTRAPSNDPPERPTRTTRPIEFTRSPSNDPPERPTRTSSHGRPQTTRPNDFSWAHERPKRTDKGESVKRAARTCTKPTSGHNLAFFIRAVSPGRALARTSSHGCPQTTRPNDFAWAPERPKRTDKGEPGKRAARTCTKPTSGHNLAFFIRPSPERPARTSSHWHPQTTRPNEFTRAPSNYPPERFCMGARTTETNQQGRAGQTTRPDESLHGKRARSNEFTWAPTHDQNEVTREIRANGRHDLCTRPTPLHNLALFIRPRVPWVPSHDTT
jgi:hypothetical protein